MIDSNECLADSFISSHCYIGDYVCKQLTAFFPLESAEVEALNAVITETLLRVYNCFSHIDNKYFHKGDSVLFSPFHSGQYCIFLYFLSNSLSRNKNVILADKVYYLNKIFHSCDIYHEVNLPNVFFLEHPVGTVLGRAEYGDNFMAMQNCTVGGNKQYYPVLGNNFKMYSGSKILGKCIVGDNVTLAANTYVKDTDLPTGVTVFGQYPNLVLKYIGK